MNKRTIKKLAKYTAKVIVVNTAVTLVAVSAILYTYSHQEQQKSKELSVKFAEALIIAKADPKTPIIDLDKFTPDQKLAIATVQSTASEQSQTVKKIKSMYVYLKEKAVYAYEEVKKHINEYMNENNKTNS